MIQGANDVHRIQRKRNRPEHWDKGVSHQMYSQPQTLESVYNIYVY